MLVPEHVLEGLDELSVENLKCGRITKEAMRFAARRADLELYGLSLTGRIHVANENAEAWRVWGEQ